jgi:site-specific DNA-adenine methylase
MYALLIHEKKLKSVALFIILQNSFNMIIIVKTRIQIILKDSKGHQFSYSHTPIHYNHKKLQENAWTNHYNQLPNSILNGLHMTQTTHDLLINGQISLETRQNGHAVEGNNG